MIQKILRKAAKRAYFKRHDSAINDGRGDGKIWHSWDPHPWKHPWLTPDNLRSMREFSERFIENDMKALEQLDPINSKIGFVGNMANNLYIRAVPLRRTGHNINIYLHPHDDLIMNHPSWEEFDGTISPEDSYVKPYLEKGNSLPSVTDVYSLVEDANWVEHIESGQADFLRNRDKKAGYSYLSNLPTLAALNKQDVNFGIQYLYLCYLANKPYMAAQCGGDVWFEASLNNELGRLQRLAYQSARVFLVSNPWSYSHARRLGLTNLVYLPYFLDETVYSPGNGSYRGKWEAQSGGDFFVLSSSRLDEKNKGSSLGIRGFATFSKNFPNARLVLIGWGHDKEKEFKIIEELGLSDKVIVLPISGKKRLIEYLRSADVFLDQFVLGYYGSAGIEAMAVGLPIVARVESKQYEALCGQAPPICNANSQAEVANILNALAENKFYRNSVSEASREWFLQNHSASRWKEPFRAITAATALGKKAKFKGSALEKRLSLTETMYHTKGLAVAPLHPHYGW
jgi:glycosyltransferase involved in cell wall biosynthesis